jgi:excisionase family DNA binding protein
VKEKTNGNQLMTPRELAQYLKVSTAWVRDHASGRRQPALPAIRLGDRRGQLRFRRNDIDTFLEIHARNAAQ